MTTYRQPKKAPQSATLQDVDPVKHMKETSVGIGNNRSNPYPGVKTSGIKIRGTGAATKGLMARGPMA
jgi:hypothetical protein